MAPTSHGKPRKSTGGSPPTRSAGCSFPVVGIGASAGGLEAFSRLLRALPARTGMAFMLVQHLDRTQGSMLADILGRASTMPVSEATQRMRVEPDHVYIIPANEIMRFSNGVIVLEERPKPPVATLSIDILLRSLADECGSSAIGVVLSGTGSDGVTGLAAIRAAGGLTFGQDPSTAQYDGMPRAAQSAGVLDEVLDIEDIAARLVRIGTESAARADGVAASTDVVATADEEYLAQIIALVRDAARLDLSKYRRTTLMRRISRRMLLEGAASMEEYLRLLQQHPAKIEALYRDVLVNVTRFFRDPEALEALRREVFPELLERHEADGPIRIWVPGCAKGQEAYSVLMTLVEFLDEKGVRPEIQMFASDVNEHEVAFARAGVYPAGISKEVSPERIARFFGQVPGGYRIDRGIREMCVFAEHDVTRDPPFSKLDLVTFRNVLIYMDRSLQNSVLETLHYALRPGGFLMLGSAETIGAESVTFSVVDKKHRIYGRGEGPSRPLPAQAPSAGATGRAVADRLSEPTPAFDVFAAAERIVKGSYQPPGILVTASHDVLQFRGHVGPYLDPAEGPPELKLSRLLGPGLSSTVEAAMRVAAQTTAPARRRGSERGDNGERREIDVDVVPIPAPSGESYYLVLFSERGAKGDTGTAASAPAETSVAGADELAGLRRDLDQTREQLDAVVSERETAISELRIAGEKFQSSNEELRTINEEFQTAQEELQSTNEELTTLNDELRSRNLELGRLTDDLNNVIEGVEIPILILDAELRIRRFTPQVDAIVSIMPTDVGRPIADFSLKVDPARFEERVREVLRSGTPSQAEVLAADGRWYAQRVRPYRTVEGAIDGVVAAFVDVDELKRSSESALAAREHAEAVIETVRQPLLVLGPDLSVRQSNDAFYETFSVSAEETVGKMLGSIGEGQWDFPELQALLQGVASDTRAATAAIEVDREFPRVGRRIVSLYARRIREESRVPSILLAIDDVTEQRRVQQLGETLTEISATATSTLEFDQVLSRVLTASSSALGADSAAFLLRNETAWEVHSEQGLPEGVAGRAFSEHDAPPALRSARTPEPVLLGRDASVRFGSTLGVESGVGSVLLVPILALRDRIGAVTFQFARADRLLLKSEIDFSRRLGAILSLAFENARLYSAQRDIASTLQGALLSTPERIPGIEFGHIYRSATESAHVGGDFYDLFELGGGRAGVLVGDVSGKGVQAATLTALVRNTVRAFADEYDSPAEVMRKTNAVVLKATPTSIFATVLYCVIDTSTGRLVYCSAGHTRSVIRRKDGRIDLLDVGSPLIGAFEDLPFSDGETTIETGDVLIAYTDGVTEARRRGELYGEERLVELIRRLDSVATRLLPEAIFNEVSDYAGGSLSDDVAIVSVGRRERS